MVWKWNRREWLKCGEIRSVVVRHFTQSSVPSILPVIVRYAKWISIISSTLSLPTSRWQNLKVSTFVELREIRSFHFIFSTSLPLLKRTITAIRTMKFTCPDIYTFFLLLFIHLFLSLLFLPFQSFPLFKLNLSPPIHQNY